ncbi:MAG: caspase family protein [Bacteroidales bacterium]|nr:caspase family protein [Bacteroidales bacterium]
MKFRQLFFITALSLFVFTAHSQIITSDKSSIYINNKLKGDKNQAPPSITLISPDIAQEANLVINKNVLNILGNVSAINGINSIYINQGRIKTPDDGFFTAEITLKPGRNNISMILVDSMFLFVEKKFTVIYNPEIVTADTEDTNTEGKYYCLIIGVNEYFDPAIPHINTPLKDANNLYRTLIDNYTFIKDNVSFIKNPVKTELIEALDNIMGKVTKNDNFLLFYSGHGWWDIETGTGYWLPSDAVAQRKETWIPNSTICAYLEEVNSKHILLIADASFGGDIFNPRKTFKQTPERIKKPYELPGRKAIISSLSTEFSEKSAFMNLLIKRLLMNEEKYLSSYHLFYDLREKVIKTSKISPQYGDIMSAGDEGGDFVFIKK